MQNTKQSVHPDPKMITLVRFIMKIKNQFKEADLEYMFCEDIIEILGMIIEQMALEDGIENPWCKQVRS